MAFKDVQGKSIDIFSFAMTHYWHTFEIACPKHEPLNGSNKVNLLYDIIQVKAFAHGYKLDTSSLM
jgi:hypothetical protein